MNRKMITLSKKERVLLARALKFKSQSSLFYKRIRLINIIASNAENTTVKTYKDAVKLLKQINLSEVLGVKRGKNFQCGLIHNNIASINVGKDGIYRYFSKTPDCSSTTMFSIVDLYEIIYNVSFYEAVQELCELFKIIVEEGQWVMVQQVKYAKNIAKIENASEEMALRYPGLYKYIEKHLYLLEKMNCLALKNLCSEKESVNSESVFFVSSRWLEEDFAKQDINKDHSTITIVLNMLCALGLIEKVSLKKVPKHMQAKAKESTRDRQFAVSFYQVQGLTTDVLLEAEKRAMKLKKAKISATMINTDNIEKVLGKRVWKSVYGDTAMVTQAIKKVKEERREINAELDALGL